MSALYNENDPYAAQWLRNLVDAGHIAPGTVSAKSILDLEGRELAGFRQAHFFAGVGVWSAALRAAGWPDSRRVWTGSCPCQPFSGAGKGDGFMDKRHLWPAWFWLVSQHRPDVIFGEQVEGPRGRAWLDLVFTDLEGLGYTCGAVVFPAAGVGAPHGRHRTYWMADATDVRSFQREYRDASGAQYQAEGGREKRRMWIADPAYGRGSGGLADADERQRGRLTGAKERQPDRQEGGWVEGDGGAADDRGAGGLANAAGERRAWQSPSRLHERWNAARSEEPATRDTDGASRDNVARRGEDGRPGPVNGFWRDPDWIFCRDNKWRPIEPQSFPLAHGAPARVGRLRAYGNAIVLQQAQAFIEAFLELEGSIA